MSADWRNDAECAGAPDGIFFPASSARVDKTPDYDVTRLYRAGHTTRQIANRYGACTKRVAAIITAAGAMRPSRGARP